MNTVCPCLKDDDGGGPLRMPLEQGICGPGELHVQQRSLQGGTETHQSAWQDLVSLYGFVLHENANHWRRNRCLSPKPP